MTGTSLKVGLVGAPEALRPAAIVLESMWGVEGVPLASLPAPEPSDGAPVAVYLVAEEALAGEEGADFVERAAPVPVVAVLRGPDADGTLELLRVGVQEVWCASDGEAALMRALHQALARAQAAHVPKETTAPGDGQRRGTAEGSGRPEASLRQEMVIRKLAEKALKSSEARLRMALNAARAGTFFYHIPDDIARWDERSLEIFGLTPEAFTGKASDWVERVHPEDRDRINRVIRRATQSEAPFDVEYRVIRPDGEVRHIRAVGVFTLDAQRQPLTLQGLHFDITEAHHSKGREDTLGDILENALHEVYLIDGETFRFLQVNQKARENLGYSMEELWEMTPLDLRTDRTREDLVRMVAPLREGRRDEVVLKSWHRRKDGTTYLTQTHLQKHHFDGRDVFVAFVHDITDRVASDAEIERLALVARETENAIVITDKEGRITWVNEGFTRITGYAAEDALGLKPSEFLQGEATDRATVARIREALKAGESIRAELVNYRKSGEPYWIEMYIQPVFGEEGEVEFFIAVEADVTERKRAEQDLARQKEELETFAGRLKILHRLHTGSHESTEALLRAYLKAGCEIFGMTTGIVSRGDEQGYTIVAVQSDLEGLAEGQVFAHSDTYCEAVVEQQKTVGYTHVGSLPGFKNHPVYQNLRLESYLGTPIYVRGRIFGTLNYSSLEIRTEPYDEHDFEIIELMARSIGHYLELEEAERARRQSQEELNTFFKVSPKMLAVISQDGYLHRLNPAWEETLGFPEEELRAHPLLDFVHPDDRGATRVVLEQLACEPETVRFENRVRTRIGAYRWFVWAVRPDEAGRLFAVVRDETDQRETEEALHESEARFESLMQRLDDVMWSASPDGTQMLYINAAAEKIYGCPVEDFFAHPGLWLERVHPEDRAVAEESARCLFETGQALAEYRIVRPDGQVRWLLDQKHLIYDEGQRLVRMGGIASDITERKEAERALRESERRYQTLADMAPVGIFRTDVNGICHYVNDRCSAFTGVPPETLLGTGWIDTIHPADREQVMASVIEAAGERREVIEEARLLRPDGEILWVYVQAHPERDEAGEVTGYVGTITDISQQKAAERIHRMHSHLLESMREGVSLYREDGYIVYTNPAHDAMFGYPSGALAGQRIDVLLAGTPREQARLRDEIAARLEASGNWRGELVNRRLDGTLFEADARISLLLIDGARFWLCVQEDVTERKKLDDLLYETQAMASVGGWEVDLIRNVLTWTDEVYRIHELPVGTPVDVAQAINFYHPDYRPVIREAVERGMSTGEGWDIECKLITARGREIWVRAIGKTHMRGGKPYRLSGTFQDITALKKVEQLKDEFVSIVSHELRTPLTSISGSLGLIAGGVAGELPPRARAMVDIAHRNAERLVRLINDMLDVQKIESGKLLLHSEPLNLEELVRHSLEANAAYADRHGVTFVYREAAPTGPLRVEGDADRLQQVMANLLSNAAKFSPTGREVVVSVERTGDRARVSVADQGPGIPPEYRDKIFDKFVQADASTRRQKEGTGLGLSISRSIVELHGGQIDFTSEPGQGATFFFELPLVEVVAPSSPDRARPRVLVCEDDPAMAELLSALLREDGYVVDVAGTVAAAEALIRQQTYDAVTLDLLLPDGNGITLLRAWRDDPALRALPVIVVSAEAPTTREQEEVQGGVLQVVDWLSKPFDAGRLRGAIRRAVAGEAGGGRRVLHVEDDADAAHLVAELLHDLAEVDHAASLREAQRMLREGSYDLVLLDVGLPDGSGLQLLRDRAAGQGDYPSVVIYSSREVDDTVAQAVAGTLVKTQTSLQQLFQTVRQVLQEQALDDQP